MAFQSLFVFKKSFTELSLSLSFFLTLFAAFFLFLSRFSAFRGLVIAENKKEKNHALQLTNRKKSFYAEWAMPSLKIILETTP